MPKTELKKILKNQATKDLIPDLEKIIEEIIKNHKPTEIIITGSLAKGEFVRGLSDIDLLVIVEHNIPNKERFTIKNIKDVDIEITIIPKHELKQAISNKNYFYTEAIKHGIKAYTKTNKKQHTHNSHQKSSKNNQPKPRKPPY